MLELKVGTFEEFKIRFLSKINVGDKEDCWEWQAATTRGYGQIAVNRRMTPAHRVMWYITYGVWPTLHVLHKCDNRACVNPDHLFEGTNKDNIQDKIAKGRHVKGEDLHFAKLSEDKVLEIRKLIKVGMLQKEIAIKYSVDPTTISNINTGKSWKHLK